MKNNPTPEGKEKKGQIVEKSIIDTVLDDELLKNHLDIRRGTSGSYYHNYILIALSDTIKETERRFRKKIDSALRLYFQRLNGHIAVENEKLRKQLEELGFDVK